MAPAGAASSSKRVFSDGVAYQVARILKMNVQAGTGMGANPGFPAGGKTGTTDDFGDAWFAGITTTASTVVWVGYPNAKIPMTAVHGIRVAGGTFPATIWRLFMVGAFGNNPPADWPLPNNPVIWQPFHGQYEFFGAPPTSSGVARTRRSTTTRRPRRPRRRPRRPSRRRRRLTRARAPAERQRSSGPQAAPACSSSPRRSPAPGRAIRFSPRTTPRESRAGRGSSSASSSLPSAPISPASI